MEYIALFVILCCALITSFISVKLFKPFKKYPAELAAYFILFYGFFSFGMLLKGYGSRTLTWYFSNVTPRLMIICSALLLLFAVVLIVLRTRLERFIAGHFLWWFLVFAACLTALAGSVTNLVFSVSLFAALICNFVFYDKPLTCDIPKKKMLCALALVSAFWGIIYHLYVPSSIILPNLMEIPVKYSWMLAVSFCLFVITSAVFFIIGLLMPPFFTALYTILFFSLTLAGYLQSSFLNGKLSLLDGNIQSYSAPKMAVNLLIWAVIIAVPIIVSCKKRALVMAFAQYASILLIVSQLIALGSLWVLTDFSSQPADDRLKNVLSNDYMTTFNQKDNVLVIILDSFDRQIMDIIEAQDSGFLDPLHDFTYYENTTSKYAFTYMAMPYLLSGVEWSNGMDDEAYISYANKNGRFLERLNELHCDIQLYTMHSIVKEEFGQYAQNCAADASFKYDYPTFFKFCRQSSRYSTLPFAVKKYYIYASDALNGVITDINQYRLNDPYVYHNIADHGITVTGKENGQFKMIHLKGAHRPFIMSKDYEFVEEDSVTREEQSMAGMNIAYEYIKYLKEAGIYDQTTIIITADHGQNFFNLPSDMERYGFRYTSAPILFVKGANETHDAMIRSSAPVSHEDFIPSVLKALGDDAYSEYGRSFDEIGESEDRTRRMVYGRVPDIPYVQYVITGDVMDEADWQLEEIN